MYMRGLGTEITSQSYEAAARSVSDSAAMWSESSALMVWRKIKDCRGWALVRRSTWVDELWMRLHRDVGLLPFPKTR